MARAGPLRPVPGISLAPGLNPGALVIGATDQNGQNISYTGIPTGRHHKQCAWPTPAGLAPPIITLPASRRGNPNHYGLSAADGSTTVNRYFQVTTVPLFQAAIFYENNLELHPGAKMVVTGLVHSNANIYALGYLANLQFMSNVSYVGTYHEGSNPAVRYGWDGQQHLGGEYPRCLRGIFP